MAPAWRSCSIEAVKREPLTVRNFRIVCMPFSPGSWPAAAATFWPSSTVSITIAWPSSASRMSPDEPRIRQLVAASEHSMIHLSQRSWTMFGFNPPSMPDFLIAASSSTSAGRAGAAERSPKEIAANGLV